MPGSIAEINYLRLGGLDQWVMIRGERIANPRSISPSLAPRMLQTPGEHTADWLRRAAGVAGAERVSPSIELAVPLQGKEL